MSFSLNVASNAPPPPRALPVISNPWNVSLDQLPPRYNYFLRCHIDGYMGRVLPTADTMLRWLPVTLLRAPPPVPPPPK